MDALRLWKAAMDVDSNEPSPGAGGLHARYRISTCTQCRTVTHGGSVSSIPVHDASAVTEVEGLHHLVHVRLQHEGTSQANQDERANEVRSELVAFGSSHTIVDSITGPTTSCGCIERGRAQA